MSVDTIKELGTTAAARVLLATSQRAAPSLSVLIFHRVLSEKDPFRRAVPDAAEFRATLEWLRSNFRVIPVSEAIDALATGTLAPATACVTFDDGYLDNLRVALPVADELGVPFTVYSTTAYMRGDWMWNDRVTEAARVWRGNEMDLDDLGLGRHDSSSVDARRQSVARLLMALKYRDPGERHELCQEIARRAFGDTPLPRLMMNEAELAELGAAGVELGGHTHSHPIISRLSRDAATEEVVSNRNALREITGQPVRTFAYPNGRPNEDYTRETVDIVRRAGFDAAFSTSMGASRPGADLMQLPRFTPWQKGRGRCLAAMALNGMKRGPAAVAA